MIKKKKGSTLVELCVVMALIAIVSVLVMSYLIMFSQATNEQFESEIKLTDENEISELLDEWIEAFDNGEYDFFVERTGEGEDTVCLLCARDTETQTNIYRLSVTDGDLIGELPGREPLLLHNDHLVSVSCEMVADRAAPETEGQLFSTSGRQLFFFKIRFDVKGNVIGEYTLTKAALSQNAED